MSEREESHDSQLDREGQSDGEEVVFREGVPNVESSTSSTHNVSPQMVTTDDLQEVIEGWKNEVPTPLRGHTRHPVGLG